MVYIPNSFSGGTLTVDMQSIENFEDDETDDEGLLGIIFLTLLCSLFTFSCIYC